MSDIKNKEPTTEPITVPPALSDENRKRIEQFLSEYNKLCEQHGLGLTIKVTYKSEPEGVTSRVRMIVRSTSDDSAPPTIQEVPGKPTGPTLVT